MPWIEGNLRQKGLIGVRISLIDICLSNSLEQLVMKLMDLS